MEKAKNIISKYGNEIPRFVIEVLDAEGSAKVYKIVPGINLHVSNYTMQALDGAMKEIKASASDTAALLFSLDHENGAIICLSTVPKVLFEKKKTLRR